MEMTMETILTVPVYEVSADFVEDDGVKLARVFVLYDEEFDSENAPSWREEDSAAVAAALAAKFGGQWRDTDGWDAGDHPKRLEAIGRFVRE
jgi:hypothetical protein